MKHIIIKTLRMVHFQAFTDMTIEFNDSENSIRGQNATGKTTIMRAVNYLLFGKDQFDRADFEIKPLTSSGEPIHNVDSEVMGELISGDEHITLRKVYHEIWRKPKGKAEVVFSGHETICYYNGVPINVGEYNAKVEAICPAQLFKLLTNPLYFPNLPWEKQRKLVTEICGNVNEAEIAAQHKAWVGLLNTINGHKTMDEYKKEIASKKRKIKEDLEKIPSRIDEVQRSLPQEEDWQNLNNVIAGLRDQMQSIDKEIADISSGVEKENEKYLSNLNLLNTKKRELQQLEFDLQMESGQRYVELNGFRTFNIEKLKSLKELKETYTRSVKNIEQEKQQNVNDREELLKEWHDLNKQEEVFFLENEFVCPTCKRPLDATNIEAKKAELTARWNEDRAKKLEKNKTKGKEVTERINQTTSSIEASNQMIKGTDNEIAVTEEKIKAGEEELAKAKEQSENWKQLAKDNKEHQRLTKEVSDLSAAIAEPVKADISSQAEKKQSIQKELESHLQRLNNKTFIDQGNKRIAELKKEQKDLAQEQADLEKIEYNIQGFIKAKIGAIEDKVNSMFSMVKFKMFNSQVNGEQVETCEVMVDGVPFRDLNNAAKINSGMDIINVLSQHYGISCPVFTDNAESINKLIPVNAQAINLYVTNDKVLTIN